MRRMRLLHLSITTVIGALAVFGVASAIKIDCPTVDTQENPVDEDPDIPTDMADCGDIKSTLKRYLLDAGYDNNAAAGIMGNIEHESGYSPKKLNGGTLVGDDFRLYINGERNRERYIDGRWRAFGLAQWLGSRIETKLQEHADSLGVGVTTLKAQATFLVKQLSTDLFGNYYKQATGLDKFNGRTLQETTWIIYKHVEAPGSATCEGQSACCTQSAINNGTCVYNAKRPPGWGGVSTLIAHKEDYAAAYKSFYSRYQKAQRAAAIDVSNCHIGSDSTSDDQEQPTSGTDPYQVPTTPSGGDTQPTTTGGTNGALGAQNVNGMVGQYDNDIKNVVWRTTGSTVSESGCSLVSVVNAARALGRPESSVSIRSVASWSKQHIVNPNWTNLFRMADQVNLSRSSWLWSSKSVSDSVKIQKIRDTLASGGVVIAGGDRSGTDPRSFCTTARKASGECVFSAGGHFVTFIGITADNKLVIANPAKANDRTWIFPASGVLKYSNKAIMVK